jgi:levansucrase
MRSEPMTNQGESNANQPAASLWTAQHVAAIAQSRIPQQSLIDQKAARPLIPDLMLWDIWPIQCDDGSVAEIDGTSLWILLSAPRSLDPDDRHDHARMRLFQKTAKGWFDCGNLLPDGFAPGSREWSGSARLDPTTGELTLWFTAAGRREGAITDFEQRIFRTVGQLDVTGARPAFRGWNLLSEAVPNDGLYYADLRTNQGVPGRIKGFRDPYWFRDPKDGNAYLLFAGSKPTAQSQSPYDGVIGIAAARDKAGHGGFALLPPIVDADGLANELERPHMFVFGGRYYLFWSSQRSVFSPSGPTGPNGLYGMVGASVTGPFEPLNGTGLVMANPEAEPRQAYAWQVLPSLEVVSFVDYWGLAGRDIATDPALKAAQFGGTIAPMAKLALDGNTSRIVEGGA